MKKVVQFKKTSLLRRACALILDLIVALLCIVVVNSLIVNPIICAVSDYDEIYESYDNELLDSHLYSKDENGFIQIIVSDFDTNLTLFFESIGELDTYCEMKENSGYFEYNEDTNTWDKKLDALDSDVKKFYLNALLVAKNDYLFARDSIKEKEFLLNGYNTLMTIIDVFAAISITFLLIPMISKDGSTIGMKPFYYQVVNKDNGVYASKMQVLVRYLVILAAYLLTSLYTLGLPLIISGLMTVFSDKKVSLVDFLTSTYVIDASELEDKPLERDLILITYDDGKEEEVKKDVYSR